MIKLEHTVLPNFEQMEFVIEGMRNPKNSWDMSDSEFIGLDVDETAIGENFILGKNDYKLMNSLAVAGSEHRKYMRMMPVWVRITAPLYWWKEFDTYKVGTVSNSCSTMHKIHEKEFNIDQFSCEHLYDTCLLEKIINELNVHRGIFINYDKQSDNYKNEFSKKDIWWEMIQLLPSSYNQTRNIMLNYEVLTDIYYQRKNHKLDEWIDFCDWIKSLPYSELIIGE